MATKKNDDFWTDDEWRCLEPLTQSARMQLITRAMFSGRGLLGQARLEGYNDAVGWPVVSR